MSAGQEENAMQQRAQAAQAELRRAITLAPDREAAIELRDAYSLIDDLLGALYGNPRAAGKAPRSPEPTPADIEQINTTAAGKIFLLQQQINELQTLLRQATEFTWAPDLSGIAHREFLNPTDWTVRIGQGFGGLWYLWRGDPRNPEAIPTYAFYDGTRFVSEGRISYADRLHLGADELSLKKNLLDKALADQVLYAEQTATHLAENKPRTYRH